MLYQPITCVWEVTMGCNMRCGHCGSSCAEALPDELNTEEALNLCNQIADLGLKWVTLSGGEPLTREKDIMKIIKQLNERGVLVNIITNGWKLNEKVIVNLKESGVATVAISIDGTEETHDQIRRSGAFAKARRAFELLKLLGIRAGAVTTITKQNIEQLADLKEELIAMDVDTWQVQLGLPMGNLKEQTDWVLEPEQVNDVIDFCYETAVEGRIRIFPADCIGYYTKKEHIIKAISYQSNEVTTWDGCNAGTRGFGILQNGDILGCTSIRSKEYIEGNIRERSLREIWEDEEKFLWRRNMTKANLSGSCRICKYGSKCLGGCPNTRLTMNGSMESENQYCAYNLELKRLESKFSDYPEADFLREIADGFVRTEEYQEASFAFERALALEPDHVSTLLAKGYCDYMCGNYEMCKDANEKAMALDEKNPYAMRGFAIALHRLGDTAVGIKVLKKAIEIQDGQDEDLLNDLFVMEREYQLNVGNQE